MTDLFFANNRPSHCPMSQPLVTCVHLQEIEAALRLADLEIEVEGDWWGTGSGKSVYFKCILDPSQIRERYDVDACVEWTEYDGRMAGHEAGFHCPQCKSFLVGGHPNYSEIYKIKWPAQP